MNSITARSSIQKHASYETAWKVHAEEFEGKNILAKYLLILCWLGFTLLVYFLNDRSSLFSYLESLVAPMISMLLLWTALNYSKGFQSLGSPALWSMLWPFWRRTDYFQDLSWEISSVGINRESPMYQQSWQFTEFAKLRVSAEGFLLYPKRSWWSTFWRQQVPYLPNHFYFLPKSAFLSAEEFEQAKSLIEQSVSSKA